MKTIANLLIAFIIMLSGSCSDKPLDTYTNEITNDRMLLILSAPSIHDPYYADAFQMIVDFQIDYANTIIGNDNVIVIVDQQTKPYYKGKIAEDVLITDDVYDIWVRDFTTVNPSHPVEFKYTWASMSQQESVEVQNSFKTFANRYGIQRVTSDLLIDGGNIVDNYAGKVVTTTRFMEDNKLTYERAKQELMYLLGATDVAIVEPDEEVLAHADGMLSWIDENTLLVNDYSEDTAFRNSVLNELQSSFPTTTIIEVPVQFTENPPGEWEGFESACGIHLNATVTFNYIYVPIFNMPHDQEVISIITKNSTKEVIEINTEGVCAMGGSVRCLTWQLAGKNAEKLILAAREN